MRGPGGLRVRGMRVSRLRQGDYNRRLLSVSGLDLSSGELCPPLVLTSFLVHRSTVRCVEAGESVSAGCVSVSLAGRGTRAPAAPPPPPVSPRMTGRCARVTGSAGAGAACATQSPAPASSGRVSSVTWCRGRGCVTSWRPVFTARPLMPDQTTAKIATSTWTTWKMTSSRKALTNSSRSLHVLPKRALSATINILVIQSQTKTSGLHQKLS